MMLALEKASEKIGETIDVDPLLWEANAWAIDRNELFGTLELLQEQNLIDFRVPGHATGMITGGFTARIISDGWTHLDKLRRAGAASAQGFIAMWFHDSMIEAYENALFPAIRRARYQPHRVDEREHADRIDDEIVAQIRRSKFVVADFTGQRGGVYWEAGFARGLGLEVFLTCQKDHLDKLHFDIRQYNCIDWETPEELADRLRKRIEAVLGVGPLEPVDDNS